MLLSEPPTYEVNAVIQNKIEYNVFQRISQQR